MTANLADDAPDTFPILFSANIDPNDIPMEWDGKSDADRLIPLKRLPAAGELRLRNQAAVIVNRTGGVVGVHCKFATRKNVFGDLPYKLKPGTVFLTPAGRVIK